MKKAHIITFSCLSLLVLSGCSAGSATTGTGVTLSSPTAQNTDASSSRSRGPRGVTVGMNIASSPAWQYAHLISGDTMDAATQQALTGFTVDKKTLVDGSMQIALHATNPSYHDQTYTLQPGQKLYFIESTLQDDKNGEDTFPGDDTAVVTQNDGTVVQP